MGRTSSLLSAHWPALVLALIIGLVMVLPQLIFIQKLGNEYKGIYMAKSDAEMHYMARMQGAVRGIGLVNPFIYEYRHEVPTTIYTISETLLALPGKVVGISVPTLNLFYKFFLPFIIALLVYALIYRLVKDRLWSISGMFLVVLGSALLNLPDLLHLLHWERIYGAFAIYSRPVNPGFSSILLFVYLHVLLSIVENSRKKLYVVLGGLLGLSFYIYLYSALYFLALNAVFLVMYLIKKAYKKSIYLALSTLVGLIAGLPFILNTYKILHHPYYPSLARFTEILSSHSPVLSFAGVISAIVLAVFAYKFRDYPRREFLTGLLVTAFIVVNQQIITGTILQEGHFHWYFNIPVFFIVLIVSLYHFLGGSLHKMRTPTALILCLLAVAQVVLIQSSSYDRWFAQTRDEQRYASILTWLDENTPKGSVVLANHALSELIPVYTENDVVWEDHAAYYLLPESRRSFTSERVFANENPKKALATFRVDYLVWDTKTEPQWNLDRSLLLLPVFVSGSLKVYKN